MHALSPSCEQRIGGRPKERFESEKAARRALARKRKFRGHRLPRVYKCDGCHGYHATSLDR
jgi:hypothetical protein